MQTNSSREHAQSNSLTGHAQSNSFTEHAQNHTETSSGSLMQTPHPPPRTGRPNLQDLRDIQAGNNSGLNHMNQNENRKQGIVRGRVVTKDMKNGKERNGQVNTGLGSRAKHHQENHQQIGKSQFLVSLWSTMLSELQGSVLRKSDKAMKRHIVPHHLHIGNQFAYFHLDHVLNGMDIILLILLWCYLTAFYRADHYTMYI